MAKRMTKAESSAIMLIAAIGLPIFLIFKLVESVGWSIIITTTAATIALIFTVSALKKKKKRESLLQKYRDAEIVDAIMNRSFWQGQTEEQLIDSLGRPVKIDQKILKTKTKEIWKYNHNGGNRYRLRITVENGLVVGWDQKT